MMHYRKGENVEQEVTKADLPFDDCMPKDQKDFLWMQVKGGTKVNNVITYAKNALEKGEYRTLVWSGSGGGLVKTVSCAEIIKRSFPLYQVTRMGYTTTEEHWTPQMEGLEEIVARRQIPCLHILMSLEVIDIEGVQKPNTKSDFWHEHPSTSHQTRENNGQRRRQQQQQHSGRSNQKKKNRKQQDRQNPQQQQQQQDRQNPQQDKQNPQQQRPQKPQQKPQQQQQKPQQQQQKTQQQQQKPQQQQPSPNAPSSSQNQSTKPENPAQREKKPKKSAKSNNPEPMET